MYLDLFANTNLQNSAALSNTKKTVQIHMHIQVPLRRGILSVWTRKEEAIFINSLISISRSYGNYFYKIELPEVQINLHFGYFELVKIVPTKMFRFEKAVWIEIDYST